MKTLERILKMPLADIAKEIEDLRHELKHIADLLDAHFERGGTVAGMGTTNKARKLLGETK